jgi:hypothetical protein
VDLLPVSLLLVAATVLIAREFSDFAGQAPREAAFALQPLPSSSRSLPSWRRSPICTLSDSERPSSWLS